ncbi:MAG: hypothetical protein WC756_04410 [Taibaiella sp.]|jgi:hypothetical protein
MYCITEQQIEYILNDIRRNGIEMEDLQLNLLDHICCMAEYNLKEWDDFEHFYKTTIKQFYKKELKEIEEETIQLLTFKNYFMLKKIMIASGAFSVILFLVGSLFKIMHWPGAGMLLVLAIVLISFLFLPLVFILKAKEVNTGLEKLTVALGTLLAILFCMDILFTVQHWPGANVLWFSTIALSIFIFIPLYFFTGIRKPETRTNTILTSIMLVGFTGLLFTAMNLRPSSHQYENQVNNYLQNEEILRTLERSPRFTVADNTAEAVMFKISAAMKRVILEHSTGKSILPANSDADKLNFRQDKLVYMDGDFRPGGVGIKLFQELQRAATDYNNARKNDGEALPAALSILRDAPDQIRNYDNIYMLNSLTQLQIYLTTSSFINTQQTVAKQ